VGAGRDAAPHGGETDDARPPRTAEQRPSARTQPRAPPCRGGTGARATGSRTCPLRTRGSGLVGARGARLDDGERLGFATGLVRRSAPRPGLRAPADSGRATAPPASPRPRHTPDLRRHPDDRAVAAARRAVGRLPPRAPSPRPTTPEPALRPTVASGSVQSGSDRTTHCATSACATHPTEAGRAAGRPGRGHPAAGEQAADRRAGGRPTPGRSARGACRGRCPRGRCSRGGCSRGGCSRGGCSRGRRTPHHRTSRCPTPHRRAAGRRAARR
jgi:hypothetical protein